MCFHVSWIYFAYPVQAAVPGAGAESTVHLCHASSSVQASAGKPGLAHVLVTHQGLCFLGAERQQRYLPIIFTTIVLSMRRFTLLTRLSFGQVCSVYAVFPALEQQGTSHLSFEGSTYCLCAFQMHIVYVQVGPAVSRTTAP